MYLTTTILLPPGKSESDLEAIFADISSACRKADLLWVGGHTEVTPVVKRTVIAGQAVGFLTREPLSSGGARPGDFIAMSKWVGFEGTTTIARERPRETEEVLGADGLRRVRAWLTSPAYPSSRRAGPSKGFASRAPTTRQRAAWQWGSTRSAGEAGQGENLLRKDADPGGDAASLPPVRAGPSRPPQLGGLSLHRTAGGARRCLPPSFHPRDSLLRDREMRPMEKGSPRA